MENSLFLLSDIFFKYKEDLVLEDINLGISQGEFVSFIGPNGSGKTTLFKVLASLHFPFKGNGFFKGKNLAKWKRNELAQNMSVVNQSDYFFEEFTVRDFVELGLHPHLKNSFIRYSSNSKKRLDEIIELCGIDFLLKKKLTTLSGGELRIVSIARALVQNSDVILLDEPLTFLDVKYQLRIMNILASLNKQGTTVVMVIHDINMAIDFSSRIIALKNGKIFHDSLVNDFINEDALLELFGVRAFFQKNEFTGKPYIYFSNDEK